MKVTNWPNTEGFVFEITAAVVLAWFTAKLVFPLLVACVVSDGNVAVMVCGLVPTLDGVTEAEHVAAFAALGARVQIPKLSPASEELSVIVPDGFV